MKACHNASTVACWHLSLAVHHTTFPDSPALVTPAYLTPRITATVAGSIVALLRVLAASQFALVNTRSAAAAASAAAASAAAAAAAAGSIVALFLALAAIQFVVDSNTPSASFLTPLQQLTLASYICLILIGLESVVIWRLTTYHMEKHRGEQHQLAQQRLDAKVGATIERG